MLFKFLRGASARRRQSKTLNQYLSHPFFWGEEKNLPKVKILLDAELYGTEHTAMLTALHNIYEEILQEYRTYDICVVSKGVQRDVKHTTEIVSKKFLHAWDNNSYYALNMVLTRQEVVGIKDFYFSNLLLYRGGNIYELISNTFLTIHKYHSLFNKYAPLQAKYFVIHLMGSLYLHTLLNKAKVLYHLFDDVSYLQELLEKGIVPRVVAGDVDRMSFVVTTLPSLTYALTIAHRFCLFDYAYPIFATGNIGRFLYPLYKKYEEEKALKTVEKMLGNYLFFSEGGRESEGN